MAPFRGSGGVIPLPKLSDFIRADKANIRMTGWTSGKVPRHNFPMSGAKAKAYKYGKAYSWALITFECLGRACRVLILINEEKEQYRAMFGVDLDGDTALLCDHEFHGDHPGWHCHVEMGDLDSVTPGANRPSKRRWPHVKTQHSKNDFGLTKNEARQHALARFRIDEKGTLC